MAQILFCEDDKDSRESLFMDLQKGFPAHAIVASETVRDGLAGVTGIDLNPRYLDHIAVETIEGRLRDSHADISKLGIVITDGLLIDRFAGANDCILNGWDLAQVLRNLNYPGKIVYIGLTAIPTGKENLFDERISKWDNLKIIEYVIGQLK